MTDDIPTIEAMYVASDLKPSDFDHSAWAGAKPVQIDHYWSGEAAPVSRRAEARVLWSANALHVRFTCNQGEPLVINSAAQFSQKTMKLWDRDVCEIFIAPDPRVVERYFEFEAAPTGEWLDVAIHLTPGEREVDWDFDSGMTAAGLTAVTKSSSLEFEMVCVGMRIPWNDWIHEPQKAERWRANVFRCVGKDPDRGYLAWRPTRTPQPSFHVPEAFGWLVFNG